MFFEEMASDRCTELILMSLFRDSTEKKKKNGTVPLLCENLSIIFGEKLLILQDKLCDLPRNIFRWYKDCSEAAGQHFGAIA